MCECICVCVCVFACELCVCDVLRLFRSGDCGVTRAYFLPLTLFQSIPNHCVVSFLLSRSVSWSRGRADTHADTHTLTHTRARSSNTACVQAVEFCTVQCMCAVPLISLLDARIHSAALRFTSFTRRNHIRPIRIAYAQHIMQFGFGEFVERRKRKKRKIMIAARHGSRVERSTDVCEYMFRSNELRYRSFGCPTHNHPFSK